MQKKKKEKKRKTKTYNGQLCQILVVGILVVVAVVDIGRCDVHAAVILGKGGIVVTSLLDNHRLLLASCLLDTSLLDGRVRFAAAR